jgi:type I restriction enzyme S subunit
MMSRRSARTDDVLEERSVDLALPEGWSLASLREVAEEIRNVKPESQPSREFGYVDISSVSSGSFKIESHKRFKGNDAPSRARRPIRPGDVLFSNVRTYLRNIAIVPNDPGLDLCSTGFTVLRSNGAVLPEFLFRYLLTDAFINRISEYQTGTHYPAVSDRVVFDQPIPLPPLAEQKRIVAKIEELLAWVNRARERLARVPAILKRFRQSVLAAACSGRLTADWREKRVAGDEGSLVPEVTHGNMLSGDETANDLPSGWSRINAGDAYLEAGYGTSIKCERNIKGGVPVLRVPNIASGRLELADLKFAAREAVDRPSLMLEPGDLLICRTNGSLDLVGKAAVVPRLGAAYSFASYLIRVRVDHSRLLPDYFHVFLTSQLGRDQIEERARTTAGQFNLNLEILRSLILPLPPVGEQREITCRTTKLLKLAETIESRLASGAMRAEKLTQAVLARAFRGELVPTEADLARAEGRTYEPARISAKRGNPEVCGSKRAAAAELRAREKAWTKECQ